MPRKIKHHVHLTHAPVSSTTDKQKSVERSDAAAPSLPSTGKQSFSPPKQVAALILPQTSRLARGPRNFGSSPSTALESKVSAGALTKYFAEALDKNLWRPQSSGRHHVEPWLTALLVQALRQSDGKAQSLRQHYANLLRQEDTLHPRHMSQVAPSDHQRSPWAYRVWPDKVQALVTLDRLVRPLQLPEPVRDGLWQPAALYKPRFTVVEITRAEATSALSTEKPAWCLHFAETPDVLTVSSLSDPAIQVQHRKSKEKDRASSTRQNLERIRQIFADPSPYLHTKLIPALRANPDAAAEDLPAFGLCSAAMLARRPSGADLGVCLDFIKLAVAQEQRVLRDYIATVRFDFRHELADPLEVKIVRHWNGL